MSDIQTATALRARIHEIREQIAETAPSAAADEHRLEAHTPAWRDGYQTAIADVLRLAEHCLDPRSRAPEQKH